jgi:hypothetical protein
MAVNVELAGVLYSTRVLDLWVFRWEAGISIFSKID